jgi:hypothetical protein
MKTIILLLAVACLTSCTKLADNVNPIIGNNGYQLVGVTLKGKRVQLPITLPNCGMSLTNVRSYMLQRNSSEIVLDSLNFTIESPSAFWFGAGRETLTLHQYESSLKITNGRIVYNNQDFGSINGDTLRLKMIPTANFNLRNSHGEIETVAKNTYVSRSNEIIIDATNGFKKATKKCGQEMWYYNVKTTELRIGSTDFSQAEWIFVKSK